MSNEFLWTSEAVSSGHPDKLADQIADAILDGCLTLDPKSTVACEVVVTQRPGKENVVFLTGEVNSKGTPDHEEIVRKVLKRVGYDNPAACFENPTIENYIHTQSDQINAAVVGNDVIGAGDQGLMFGFASNETEALMPAAHNFSFVLINELEKARREAGSPLLPDAKTQVTLKYEGHKFKIDTLLISTQHEESCSWQDLSAYVYDRIIQAVSKETELGKYLYVDTKIIVNPAGAWSFGGPAADTGLSGRKIVVDNYGGDCPVGGGSFSGKDPTKVDRSAAYAARQVAKTIVEAGIADKAQVQLAYAIGVAQPVSVRVKTESNSSQYSRLVLPKDLDHELGVAAQKINLTPDGIIDRLGLRNPVFGQTAYGGHFGRPELPWEKTHPEWFA